MSIFFSFLFLWYGFIIVNVMQVLTVDNFFYPKHPISGKIYDKMG